VRLAAFTTRASACPQAGVVLDGERVVDLAQAHADRHRRTRPARALNEWFSPSGLEEARQIGAAATRDEPWVLRLGEVSLAPAVPGPGKIIAAGRNYQSHVDEGAEVWASRGRAVARPPFPSGFVRVSSSLIGHGQPILVPPGISTVDYELELAAVIGRPALRVSAEHALEHVAGYTICNEVSAREIQLPEMEQLGILMAKNFPGFGPLGPWVLTAEEIADPQDLDMHLSVNGELRQRANTGEMLFTVAELVAHWSRIGLETGDVILTGTPAGVALAMPEPERCYLRAGDVVSAVVEGIGELRNPVR
jgi:2-keto-4-pentenoate hydratase/2-oxohepta-3-ene-1,7-dioic acid hydratase in catechol pathway